MSVRNERGATAGDMLIFLATLCVAAALLYPAWSMRDFRARVEGAVADVETLSAAARSFRADANRWPTPSPLGEAPPELSGLGGEEGVFNREGYTLGWTSWEVVDSVEAPPLEVLPSADDARPDSVGPRMLPVVRRFGAVAVHSDEEALLAELMERYTPEKSVVLDSIWLLTLPERAEAPPPPRR